RGRYVDDLAMPGLLHAAVVRSPHAHAKILGMDLEEARALRGVRLVLSHVELAETGLGSVPLDLPPPGFELEPFRDLEQPLLARSEVRYVGDPVVFIVADSHDDALAAAEQVFVDYENLPAVTSIETALRGDVSAVEGR